VGTLLTRAAAGLLAAVLAMPALADGEHGDRHELRLELDASFLAASSTLGSWTTGGLGKLRYAEDDDGLEASRLFVEYGGRITPTLHGTAIVDYVDDASSGLGITEAYLDWHPIPKSRNQHQVKFGAFYPPLSLENGADGWNSPFTYSYSAIDTWLGEEIRPVGAEWSLRRRLGFSGSLQELRAFAAGFYGGDPAGTLLFWRGWGLHDRQTRFNDKLPMPPTPIWDATGTIVGFRDQWVRPLDEIDHRPGAYLGLAWRYSSRALVQLLSYDNRADANAFRDGQWGWHTRFAGLSAQISLPGQLGLLTESLKGSTYWIVGARPDGTLSPRAELVEDGFAASYLILTRVLHSAHRLSLRYDSFDMTREEAVPQLHSDAGRAWTLAYRYARNERLSGGIEWLNVRSSRDLWAVFYGVPRTATERELRLQVTYKINVPTQ
jgi:hypothetical protein